LFTHFYYGLDDVRFSILGQIDSFGCTFGNRLFNLFTANNLLTVLDLLQQQ